MNSLVPLALFAGLITACAAPAGDGADGRDWPVYGGGPEAIRYSPLSQIHTGNVHRLEVAWTYTTGELPEGSRYQIQCNPIVVEGVLYGTTPTAGAFAVDAGTGRELWTFDPWEGGVQERHISRGVVHWGEGDDRRILHAAGNRLFALNAATGRPIPTFGQAGWVDLRAGLGRDTAGLNVSGTTPGVVFGDLLIQGMRVSEGEGAAPGHIRAYDVRTGEIRWTFHTIPHPGEFGHDTWPPDAWKRIGGANSWAGMSVDLERGIVYAPTGSAAFDFYGGDRLGANLFANSVLALDARTGERIWHFQTVHHDLWDRDLPAQPALVTVRHGGEEIDAVAQITKTGFVYLLDRETGSPLFPVVERPVPPSDVAGEVAWPTQPMPLEPEPFVRQNFTEELITDRTPEAHAAVLQRFRELRSGDSFMPPSLQGTVVLPGYDGGGEWGGAAFDPATGVLYINANEMVWVAQLVEKEELSGAAEITGEALYQAHCAACHGRNRLGDSGRTPPLVGVADRLSEEEIRGVMARGQGFMPSFDHLTPEVTTAIVEFLTHGGGVAPNPRAGERLAFDEDQVPYRWGGYRRFLDPDGYPAIDPPWGTLNALDLDTGEYLWKVPLGEFPELSALGIPRTGTENYGGPIVTAGGLVFIGASQDEMFRAFDKQTGEILWEAKLPAGGYATPSTYMADGVQYVVIAAGGGKMGTPSGNSYVAFRLGGDGRD